MPGEVIPRSSSAGYLSRAEGPLLTERPLQLGKYRLIARVGSGGGAAVFLALASGAAGVSKLLVAKVLREDLADDPSFVAMFFDEARLTTRLNHPNIVQMLEVGLENGLYFIIMEYLEGKPLSRLMGASSRLPAGMIPGIGRDVLLHLIAESLDGLHYAHELTDYDGTSLGVVHRDFSPQNIFITYDGHAKLLDFGVAKVLTSSVKTEIDVLKGKPRYMSPEHLQGGAIDRRADVFSAGVVLWEAVSGQRMWAGKNDMAVLYAVGSAQVPAIEDVAPGTPPELVRIIHRALAPSRDQRYPSALALQEDLEAYLRATGSVPRARDVGRALAAHFAADRAQINAAVETQVRALASESPSQSFRLVSIPDIETGALGGAIEASDARAFPSSAPTVIPASLRPPPKGGGFRVFGIAAVLAVAVVGSVFWVTPRAQLPGWLSIARVAASSPPSPGNQVSPPAAAVPPPLRAGATAPPVRESVKLAFKASPPDAQLFLDGKALGGNPFSGQFPKGGATHVLRAEAAGYATKEESLSFARDADLDLTLAKTDVPASPPSGVVEKPAPRASASPASSTRVGPVPASGASAVPAAEPAPALTTVHKTEVIDPNDPYAE